jgi:NADPH-dependent glutamate synthase beta subunit-like oxidoreductase
MNMTFLSFGFSFHNLYDPLALQKLDTLFLTKLEEEDANLEKRLRQGRKTSLSSLEESALLLDLAPYVEEFVGILFGNEKDIHALQQNTYHLAPLYQCKRLFVQRQAAKAYSKEEALSFNGEQLKKELIESLGESYTDLCFARHVLKALETNNTAFLEMAKKYAAWALYQINPSVLFRLPRKIDSEALIPLNKDHNVHTSPHRTHREGFDCTDPGVTPEEALDQAHYCIVCHPQDKDSCSKGLTGKGQGCPLGQKISEMNSLRTQGYLVGALAMIMVDNPMVAATGNRICNDCMKTCIFQKQEAVNIPSVETQILDSVLNLPWGVEIYSLLSRWNPLNLKQPFPKPLSGYKVLVAGMGPAGFTLAHYLLNEGHTVVGMDRLKIEPLSQELLTTPISSWQDLKEPLSQRIPEGFGGVSEYGITARWDKNYLKLIRLLLERRSYFSLYDGVHLGKVLTLPQAFEMGFDHVALCLGAGRPRPLEILTERVKGVRLAASFLMDLQLTDATHEQSLSNLQIRLPILVVGGGLTAVDTATEALAYYPVQVERFTQQTESSGGLSPSLSNEEREIAEEFLNHAREFRADNRSLLEKGSTIVYRKTLQESPSYRLNAEELDLALRQGVRFLENAAPHEIKVDASGHIESLIVTTPHGLQEIPCRTLLISIGTHPNKVLEEEDLHLKAEEDVLISYKGKDRVSFFGDLHPIYEGNVVKAMASAKDGYPRLCQALSEYPPSPTPDFFEKLDQLLRSEVD